MFELAALRCLALAFAPLVWVAGAMGNNSLVGQPAMIVFVIPP
jgi:hypothetical protein